MGKKKIMIVDDEEDFLEITKTNIEELGEYEVLTLRSAEDIISIAHSFKPDLILLDILMPKIDGVETCMKLNQDRYGSKIPIIVLSAIDTIKDKLMMYKLGVVDFLVKPIEENDLIAKIEKVLRP